MKFIYFISLISFGFIIMTGCKKDKEISPEEIEEQKVETMRKNIINDWKILKIMTIKPVPVNGTTIFCPATFSFYDDHTFNYTGDDPACTLGQNIKGTWELPKSDSLFITFTGNHIIGAYEKLEVTKLTADTMKWNILAASANGIITQEYTLIPK